MCRCYRRLFLCIICFQATASVSMASGDVPLLRGNGMSFLQNMGQIIDMDGHVRADILFKGTGGGADIYLRKTGMSYVRSDVGVVVQNIEKVIEEKEETGLLPKHKLDELKQKLKQQAKIKVHRLDIDFADCNPNPEILSSEKVEGYSNFYYPHCPDGITNVYSYNTLIQKNVYYNIDVKYYGGKEQGLKYDIVVKPGGNPDQIKMRYDGAKSVKLINGRLQIETELGIIDEYMPRVYQNINGKIVDLKAEYKLAFLSKGDEGESEDIVTFKIERLPDGSPAWNSDYSLIIDPWVTYYGGVSDDQGNGIATDSIGNVFITGNTLSANFPVLAGFQMTYAFLGFAGGDAFVVKLNEGGIRAWATYYGGYSQDYSNGIATDSGGNVYITGTTWSPGFPVFAGFQMVFGGGIWDDAFVVKFNNSGVRIWATYCGGAGLDEGKSVSTDTGKNVLITGVTQSSDFPVLNGWQMVIGGVGDAFVVKLNASGVLIWSTFFGGTFGYDLAQGITTDSGSNVFITGYTYSSNFPVLAGFQMSFAGGNTSGDVFIVKFNSAGTCMWSSYYGGNGEEQGSAITTDSNGNVFVTGSTGSANFPVFAGFQMTSPGGAVISSPYGDAFVIKFNNSGTRLWATYLGGSFADEGYGIVCDNNNNIIVSGDTYIGDFPVTSCAYQTNFMGSEDQFVTRFDTNCKLICSSLMGEGVISSDNNENGYVAIHGCYVYLLATTTCTYPVTGGAFQTACGGGRDCALAQFYLSTCGELTKSVSFTGSQVTGCVGTSINYTSNYVGCDTTGIQYLWSFDGGTPFISTAKNPTAISYNSPGTYDVKLVIQLPCRKDSVIKSAYFTINPPVNVSIIPGASCTAGQNSATVIASGGAGLYTYSWSNGVSSITTSTQSVVNNLPSGTYTVTVTNSGCFASTSVTLANPVPVSIASFVTNITCDSANGIATIAITGGEPGYTYSWSNGVSGATMVLTNSISKLSAGNYSVTVTDINGCSAMTSITVNKINRGTIIISPDTQHTIWEGNSVVLSVSGGVNYTWSPMTGLSCTNCYNPTAAPLVSTIYNVMSTDSNGCILTATVEIVVKPGCSDESDVFVANVFSPNNDGRNDLLYIEGNGLTNIYWAIYDRWGNRLFETFDQMHGWDGTYNGKVMDNGTYVYYLKATCIKTNSEVKLKGNVSIVH